VVAQPQLRRLAVGRAGGDGALADRQTLEPAEVAAVGAQREGGGDVAAVDVDAQRGRLRAQQLDERVAAGEDVGAVGEHPDLDVVGRGGRRREGEREQPEDDQPPPETLHPGAS
jgi:hypothetical protein